MNAGVVGTHRYRDVLHRKPLDMRAIVGLVHEDRTRGLVCQIRVVDEAVDRQVWHDVPLHRTAEIATVNLSGYCAAARARGEPRIEVPLGTGAELRCVDGGAAAG